MRRMNYFGRYLYKWFLLIFSLFALISIVFNALSYYREKRSYSEAIEKEQQSRIDYLSRTIDSELVKLKITANMFLRESAVQDLYCKYDFMNSHEKNELFEAIEDRCREIDNLNLFVSSSSYYLPKEGLTIDKKGYRFTEGGTAFLKDAVQAQELITLHEGKIYMIEMSRKNYLKGWDEDNLLGVFVLELDADTIQKELSLAKVVEGDILFLTDYREKEILCQTTETDLSALRGSAGNKVTLEGESYGIIQSTYEGDFFRLYYLQDQAFVKLMAKGAVFNMLVFAGVVMAIMLVAFGLFYESVYHPLEILLVDAFGQIKKSNFSYRISLPEKENVFSNLYRNFNHMAEKIDTLVTRELKQQILLNQADFKYLQAQINPHFMYNSYFLLYRMIKNGDREGSLMICENLGEFFKYITRDSKENKSLAEEISHARSYAVIQQFRYQNRIHMDFPDLPEKFGYIEVPRLIVQPLLENIFKYAVNELEDDELIELKVSYEETREHLLICVENSGSIQEEEIGIIREKLDRQDEKAEITALVNVSSRLNLFFNQQKSLTLGRSDLGGLKACLHLKL